MCAEVCVNGRWCGTGGELRAALPDVPLVKEARYDTLPSDGCCLCGVDLPATLTAAGLWWKRDECGDYHVSTEQKE